MLAFITADTHIEREILESSWRSVAGGNDVPRIFGREKKRGLTFEERSASVSVRGWGFRVLFVRLVVVLFLLGLLFRLLLT